MNEKWMRPVELMEILLNFLTVFCVETALFAAFVPLNGALEGEVPEAAAGAFLPAALPYQLLLAGVPVCFWLIRIFVSRFWLFSLLHAGVFLAAVLGLGQNGIQRAVFGILAGLYLIVSFRNRLQEGREDEGLLGPAVALIAAAASILLCAYLGDGAACGRILNAALLYAFLFFADTYLRNLERFIQFNKSSNSHIPVRRMLLRGGGLTAVCSLCVVALLALGANQTFMDRAGEALKNVLLWCIRGIFRLIRFLFNLFGSEGGEQAAAVREEAAMQLMETEVQKQPLWLEVLYQIVEYMILIGAAVLVVFLLYKAVTALARMFYEGKTKRTQDGQKTEEIRETLRVEKKKRDRQEAVRIFARTPEERIRRIFVRTVQKSERFRNPEGRTAGARGKDLWRKDAREKLVRAKTARELEVLFPDGEGQKEAFAELAGLYEKARYAGTDVPGRRGDRIGPEDVKRAEACRDVLLGKKG